ncbi:DUF6395 domain-containing protein [Candidatus Poseidoniales archaeon]|nr:DUF6395 domain-containing protein [Candidatus Poseidoniales archaeon]
MGDASMPLHALRRWRIRRLYNQGNLEKARRLANHEIDGPNHGFAIPLIVRALYNEEKWHELVAFVKQYPGSDTDDYCSRAKRKVIQLRELNEGPPMPNEKRDWDPKNLLSNWLQERQRLWLRHPNGWVHWDMPDDFKLSDTHEALLHLALEVLLSPWVSETKKWERTPRKFGKNTALSYSGGVDSTAAMILMPEETLLAYHERNFTSMLNHSLPHSTFDAIEERTGRTVLRIPSNHEKIRTHYGLKNGFSTANAASVHLILLADYLDLSGIAFGTPIDNTWLQKGSKYRDFESSHYWEYWGSKFRIAGLKYILPINHISEAGAISICKQSQFVDVVNSCLRGSDDRWCGKCWKCFHKNGPLGRKITPRSKEITTFLHDTPLRTAQHALWAIKYLRLEDHVPHLKPYIENDLSWWEKAYSPGLELIDEPLRQHIRGKTEQYLQWMENPFTLETIHLEI